ncbi:cell division protein FtsQ/DivIB [Coraliomargarita parva]|uniref:cell division protein FtsQ/DivIB n=1 Tax=Coraliomargarita parva TaxID=3014050 RepID=UPI0022B332F4|nr:FtsQ-type POTRA domain-containing protein [Coraliomargarita parva]
MIGRGSEKGSTSASGSQSWRELAGPRRKRINSPQAKKRRREQWFKLFLVLLSALALGGAVTAFVLMREQVEEKIEIKPPSRPIERILFNTNGVLPNTWLSSVIRLQPGTEMMDVDIHALKLQLEKEGQVKMAEVKRVFPSALQISVEERVPVMRLLATLPDGSRRQRIVARDGVVYDGLGYPRSTLHNLPYIIPYQKADGQVFPLKGIEHVADLLDQARQDFPALYAGWQVVDLRHFSGDIEMPGQVVEVRSKLVPRVIFGASSDFGQQLDRLQYILSYVQRRGDPSIERIDLSLRDAAAVQFSSGRVGTF